ncbi:hypothetical protein PIB30_071442 [Stylosanthes scabra]|uniref:Secreted protein n=1 Tax=Stylosanthes scabra TaxID=79078 RepID=A0ABU6VNS6_9FABA|nr:hypothetical protein [Stylosanthes scabra]
MLLLSLFLLHRRRLATLAHGHLSASVASPPQAQGPLRLLSITASIRQRHFRQELPDFEQQHTTAPTICRMDLSPEAPPSVSGSALDLYSDASSEICLRSYPS